MIMEGSFDVVLGAMAEWEKVLQVFKATPAYLKSMKAWMNTAKVETNVYKGVKSQPHAEFEEAYIYDKPFNPPISQSINYADEVVDASTLIQKGEYPRIGNDYVNIDLVAEKGINGAVTDLSKFIKPNSIESIVVTNPKIAFLEQCSIVMKPGTQITINGTVKNPFFNKVVTGKVEQYGFKVIQENQPLGAAFGEMKFFFTGGVKEIPSGSMRTTILIKQ